MEDMMELEYNQESHDYWKNIIDNGYVNLPSQGMISYWLAHIELCHAIIKDLETSTYCAYCGERCELDDEAASKISSHIKSCKKHPMRKLEADLRAQLAEKDKEIERLKDANNLLDIRLEALTDQ